MPVIEQQQTIQTLEILREEQIAAPIDVVFETLLEQIGPYNETPDKAMCQSLVDHIASLFGKAAPKPLPDFHIHHPDHAPIVNPAIPEV